MTIQHKLVTIKAVVSAIVAERDYYRDKCVRQEAILEEIKEMIMASNATGDEILVICNQDIDSISLIENDPTVFDIPYSSLLEDPQQKKDSDKNNF